jgi:hypothetical protein
MKQKRVRVHLNLNMVNLDWTVVPGMSHWVEVLLVVVVIVNLHMSTSLVVFFLTPVTTKKGSTRHYIYPISSQAREPNAVHSRPY